MWVATVHFETYIVMYVSFTVFNSSTYEHMCFTLSFIIVKLMFILILISLGEMWRSWCIKVEYLKVMHQLFLYPSLYPVQGSCILPTLQTKRGYMTNWQDTGIDTEITGKWSYYPIRIVSKMQHIFWLVHWMVHNI